MTKTLLIGYKKIPVYIIRVAILENDNDYEFVFIDGGNKKQMAVF